MSRYGKTQILINDNEYYRSLVRKRGVNAIKQYATPVLKNPTIEERSQLAKTTHIWKYGDRFYKLSNQYYGDPQYWWIIAWYNSTPTEANISTGTAIRIPLNIEEVLAVLGA
jgi:nucleoid-associated protein YgaU